jgi:hypothetical protein
LRFAKIPQSGLNGKISLSSFFILVSFAAFVEFFYKGYQFAEKKERFGFLRMIPQPSAGNRLE